MAPFAVLIIPVFNHADKIGGVLEGAVKHFPASDILVVNDGSTDHSAEAAQKVGVNVISLSPNQGKGRALTEGFRWAAKREADWVVTMDADGQHSPEEIPRFLSAAQEKNWDFIIGARSFSMGKMPFPRSLSNRLTSRLLSWATGQPVLDSQCGFRAIQTRLLTRMQLHAKDYILETEMILQASAIQSSLGWIPVSTRYCGEKSHMRNMRTIFRFAATLWKNRAVYRRYARPAREDSLRA